MTSLGLTSEEAEVRLRSHGPNLVELESESNWFRLILSVLREPMLLLLLAAGAINFLLAEVEDALLLMVTVAIVLLISVIQERRSERAIQSLRDLTAPLAHVFRDGVAQRVPSTQVVVGDLLILQEGDRVVADALITSSASLALDESLLTGESIPVDKSDHEAVYAGSLVLRGHGRAIVSATGVSTELGKIGKSLQDIPYERTRLQSDINRLVRVIGGLGFVTVIAIIISFGLTRSDWLQGALAGIAAAMALIPEEFPVILTLFFALGAWRMAKVRVIARKSAAIEALGSITVLCVDKTGTLTRNQMAIERLQVDHQALEVQGNSAADFAPEFQDLIRTAAMAAPRTAFDPMDRAFKGLSEQILDLDKYESIREFPVERDRLGYIHIWRHEATLLAAAKGAPEYIAKLCGLDLQVAEEIAERVRTAAGSGFRVLAVARAESRSELAPELSNFKFRYLGIALLRDPIRDGVPEAVTTCSRAGIRTVMITGDHPATAISIAREIGLTEPERCLVGDDLVGLDDLALAQAVSQCSVFARVRPEHKLRLVRAFRSLGEVVAMTGDGVNDAPALRAADIGIAMGGRGTDVAREAAALVITDDDFTSIVAGIRRGRAIYANMQKAMSYVIAVHVPIFGMALAPVFNSSWPLILLPALVAFHEVIIDPACSIVYEVEEPDPKIMERAPRSREVGIFKISEVLMALGQGLTVLVSVFAVFLWALSAGRSETETRSLTFATLLISNLLLILTNRSRILTISQTLLRRKNIALPWILLLGVALVVSLLNLPFLSRAFDLAPIEFSDYFVVIAAAYLGICWTEIWKIWSRIKSRQ